MNPEWNRLARHLRPGDEQFVRGVDPTTAGLTLMLLAGAREMAQALFPRWQSDRGLAPFVRVDESLPPDRILLVPPRESIPDPASAGGYRRETVEEHALRCAAIDLGERADG